MSQRASLAFGVLAAFALVLAPSLAAAKPVPADHNCMGPWVGTGRNSNSPVEWTIELHLNAAPSGGRCGTIEYTNPTCGGTLEDCELRGEDIHTRESYTHNDGSCAPPGRVVIRCEGDTMRYSWHGWEQVDSTLTRPEGYQPPATVGNGAGPPPAPGEGAIPPPQQQGGGTGPTPGGGGGSQLEGAQQPQPSPPAAEERGGGCGACAVARAAGGRGAWRLGVAFVLFGLVAVRLSRSGSR